MIRRGSAEVIVWLPSLNSSVFHLLEDKLRFSTPLRNSFLIKILENNGKADRGDVIEKSFRYIFDNHKKAFIRLTLNRLKILKRNVN